MQRQIGRHRDASASMAKHEWRLAIAQLKFAVAELAQVRERKAGFNSDQPRDDRGRWSDTGAGASFGAGDSVTRQTVERDSTGEQSWDHVLSDRRPDGSIAQQLIFNRDGSVIHEEFARPADKLAWDERYTVVTTSGDRIRFETTDDVQTITDADTGEVISRARWTDAGAEPEATLQPAFAPERSQTKRKGLVEAGAALFTWMSSGNRGSDKAVQTFKVDAYAPGTSPEATPTWIGRLAREETDAACPRHQEVQRRTDAAAEEFRGQRDVGYLSPTQYGTAVHTHVKHQIDRLNNPDFRAEVSMSKTDSEAYYSARHTIRIDVLERVGDGTVCVYDIKTGRKGLKPLRITELVGTVFSRYPDTSRIILIETRPRR